MEDQKGFLLFDDLETQLADFSNEQVGILLRGLLAYHARGEIRDFGDSSIKTAFSFLKSSIDRNARNYDRIRSIRKESGYKGAVATNERRARQRSFDSANAANADFAETCISDSANAANPAKSRNRNRNLSPLPPKGDGEFDSFWKVYPRKVGKDKARKAFSKLNGIPSADELIRAVQQQAVSEQWTKDGGQFIPYPATWLDQRRWEDEENNDSPSMTYADDPLIDFSSILPNSDGTYGPQEVRHG
jgi:hypothetical protein